MSFRNASLAASVVALGLCVVLMFLPHVLFWLFGVPPNAVGDFMAKRTAALFLGFSTLCFLSRNAPDSEQRRAISAAVSIGTAGLALTGLYEFWRGYAGAGIWLVIIVELGFALAFARFWLRLH